MALKPFTGELDPVQSPAQAGPTGWQLKPFDGTLDGETPKRTLGGTARDVGVVALNMAMAVPEAAVGLADLATFGRAGKLVEDAGIRFKDAKEITNSWHSDAQKRAIQNVDEAEGFWGTTQAALQNPSVIAKAAGESLGLMGAGGVAARGLMAGRAAMASNAAARAGLGAKAAQAAGQRAASGFAPAAAAIGEGASMAGGAAEQIRQETDDGYLTGKQAALALGTGALGAGFGLAGGRLANRLGIGDVDTMLAQGQKGIAKGFADDATTAAVNPAKAPADKGLARKLAEGILSEGVLEELPQSVSEQILQNIALGKPWDEGVDKAAAMGILAGGAMGAGGAGYHHMLRPKGKTQADDKGQDDQAAKENEWTTEPGAAPGGLTRASEVPDALRSAAAAAQFSTEPGAAPEKQDGIEYQRDVDTSGLSQAIAPATQAQAREFDTGNLSLEGETRAPLALTHSPDPLIVFPDGSVGRRAEADAYIESLPESERVAARARLMGLGAQPSIKPSEAMGLNAADGALSAAAVASVDSGFSQSLQQAAGQSVALASSPAKAMQQAQQAAQKVQALQGQVNDAREKLLSAMPADLAGQDVDAAMRSRAVPVTLKAQYQMLNRQLADAQQAHAQVQAQVQPQAQAVPQEQVALDGVQVLPSRGGDEPVLQNRDRSTAASVAQMQEIAANPDYVRTGPSRTMDTGAPVVFGELPASAVVGRAETVADGMGRRVQAQYAVVDAADVLTSHTADGASVPGYAEGQAGKLRAVAGNGRAAGIAAAHDRGTAEQYRQELMQDAESLGLDAAAIQGMRAPMLVRVMDGQDVTPDIADRSNTASTQRLSPVEEAANDARRVDLTALQFDDNGNLSAASVRGFIQSLPVAERGDMLNPDGTPTRQALDRITAAAFKQAYGHDELVRLSAQATDAEARAIMNALAEAAPQLAALSDAGEFDLRQAVADAAVMAVNAQRRGLKLADLVQNADLDMNPEAFEVARFFAENIRSGRKMAEGLKRFAQLALEQVRIAEENLQQGGMFGDRPTLSRQELLESLNNGQASDNIQQQYTDSQAQRQAADAQQRGPELSGQGAEGSALERGREGRDAADSREGGAGQAEEVAQDAAQQAGDVQPSMFSRSKGDAQPDENERQFKDTERAYGGKAAYERAKAEGKTKLNYRQWVQVRTPNFKRWFGDWEIASAGVSRAARTFAEARDAVKTFGKTPIVNQATGMSAKVSRGDLDKMLSKSAVSKSVSPLLHSLAVANIDQLFHRAVLGWSKPDRDNDPNIVALHRFFTPLHAGGESRLVKLTVKERRTASNGVYSVEAVEFSERNPGQQWVRDAARLDGVEIENPPQREWARHEGDTLARFHGSGPNRSAEDVLSLAQRVQDFNPAEVSKVTDPATGEPLVVYHGTDADFSVFSHDELGKTTGAPSAKRGFFFSDSVEMAEWYQQYPIELIHEATGVSAQLENRAAENVWDKVVRLRDELNQAKDALAGQLTQFERSLLFDGRVTGPKLVAAQREVYGPDGEFGPPDDWTRERKDAARQQLNERLIQVRDAELSALAQRDTEAASYLALKQEHDAAMQQGRFWDEKLRWSEKAHAGGTADGETWDAKKNNLAPNTMPVFLNIRNALVHDFKGQGYRDVSYNELLAQAQEQGQDGAMLLNTSDPTPGNVFVAFNATDIKSAIGNTSAFSYENPDIRYSRTADAKRKPLSAELARKTAALQQAVNAIHAKWANAPETVVVADMNDARIPQAVRDADQAQRSQGAQGEPEGFYYGGKVYLVAGAVQDAQAAARVMAHETLGHHGLQGLFGKRLDSVLNRLVIARNAEVKAKAKEYGLDMGRAQDRRIAAEEVLAEMAQEQPDMGLVREAIAAIRSWLREHVPGFADMRVSDDEIIRDYILPARDWVMRGRQAKAERGYVNFKRAWHGTPYRGIEKTGFKLNKIGTGEGAQAYGWGMYFASERDVANWYAKALAQDVFYIDGKPVVNFDADQPRGWAINNLAEQDADALLKWLDQAERDIGKKPFLHQRRKAVLALRGRKIEKRSEGQLYQVEVPEDGDLLDWDKPLDEQPPKVQQALERHRVEFEWERGTPSSKHPDLKMYGSSIYGFIQERTGSPQAASEYLLSLGIPGLRYLDGNSRSQGEGSHNYVIWDEALLTPEAAQIQPMFSRSKATSKAERDRQYMQAVEAGDMETAQRMVNEAAAEAGYETNTDWRMSHSAPNSTDGMSVNMLNLQGSGLVPDDFFTHPHYYAASPEEMSAAHLIVGKINDLQRWKREGLDVNKMSVTVYRAVPKDVKEDRIRNGDWVALTREYAQQHGQSHVMGGYRIISHKVPAKHLYWDGNSTAEWGVDDGKEYAYRNTKNNRKLLDAVTRDDDGSVIPLSKRFNARDFDTRFSRSKPATQAEQDSVNQWDAPEASRFDDLAYKLQDKHIDTKRVQEAIEKVSGKIADEMNVRMAEELYHGRSAKRVQDFAQDEVEPLLKLMQHMGLDMAKVEEFLHARHAKEANALIAQRDENMPDGGSGMSNADADAYFASLSVPERMKLENVAAQVDAMIAGTRQLFVDYGLESQDTVDGWGKQFKHYVPLMREGHEGGMGIGQGFSVKGREVKSRTGSTRKVVDILANIVMQRERVIVRGEKNRVAQAAVALAEAHPHKQYWTVGQTPKVRALDDKGKVVERVDPLYKDRENVLVAKVRQDDGSVVEKAITFNENNPRAVRMAQALKNLDAAQLEGLLGASAVVTRYFAAVNTQYNPVFGLVNVTRDVQGALVNLQSTPLAGMQAVIAKDTLRAIKAIYTELRGQRKGKGKGKGEWAKLLEQFQQDGGQTGYRDQFATSADRAKALQKLMTPQGWMDSKLGRVLTAGGALKAPATAAQKGLGAVFDWLSDYNDSMENAVRLAAYKAALDKGLSRPQAASIAKNLTVNFNRKGQSALQAGALYAFFNAAMQGTARIGEALFTMERGNIRTLRLSKTGRQVVYGGMVLGALQALALAAAGLDDDEVPEFVRERNIIIPVGDGKYIQIPMPLGLHVIPGLGRHAMEFALSGGKEPAKRVVDVFGMMAEAFNPIGNAGLSMQTLAPTPLDPLVALTENRDWTGKEIARKSRNEALPGHLQGKDTSTFVAKGVAKAINYLSGGNGYRAGVFSPTPDQIDYLIGQAMGGVGREASKVIQTGQALLSGEELPAHKRFVVGRFWGDSTGQSTQSAKFYGLSDRLNVIKTEAEGLRKDGLHTEAMQLMLSNPQSSMAKAVDAAHRQISALRKQKRELIAQGAPRARVREIEDRMSDVMRRINERAEAMLR